MAIPAGVTRISLQGAFVAGDIFDTSVWVRGAAIASDADANSFAADVATIFNAQSLGFLPLLDSGSKYTAVKVYHYPTGGPTATYVGNFNIIGGVGTGSGHMPHQVCIVVTTRTAFSGRSKRGRMYLPATGINLTSDLQMNTALLSTAMGFIGGFFEALKTMPIPATAVVVSTKLTSTSDIVEITADTQPDIQRRRGNKVTIDGVIITPVP